MNRPRPRLNPNGTPVIWWIGTSTPHQKLSPLSQFDLCWETSLRHDLYPIAILRVPGHSRSYIFFQDAAHDIPAYQKLLQLLSSTPHPVYLLTQARDRLGRNALATQVEALCEKHKVKIWSVRTGMPVEGNVGQIFAAGMELTMSRAESHQTQDRRRGAVLRRVKDKHLPYGKPEYGYKTVRDERGKSIGVTVDPTKGNIRQMIDEWFISGNSPVVIARRLQTHFENGEIEYAPPAGELWYEKVVRGLLKSRFPSGEYRATISGEHLVVLGDHPKLRTVEQQEEIDRQFLLRKRGTQRGNTGPARYYGVAYCADCGQKMIRIHPYIAERNQDLDYSCSQYQYSKRTPTKICSTHYTYESMITNSIIQFFQQPVDDIIADLLQKLPQDRTSELENARNRLEKIRNKKLEAVRLRLDYPVASHEFDQVINELATAEADTRSEIAELEANQVRLPDIDNIRNWVTNLLSVQNLQEWLSHDDPNTIRTVLGGRVRVYCHQRKYKAKEPQPTVELSF